MNGLQTHRLAGTALASSESKIMLLGWKGDADDPEIRDAIIDGIIARGTEDPLARSRNPLGRGPGTR